MRLSMGALQLPQQVDGMLHGDAEKERRGVQCQCDADVVVGSSRGRNRGQGVAVRRVMMSGRRDMAGALHEAAGGVTLRLR